MEINLISDTVTKPSTGMLNFMYDCNVGDDVFKQDPTVNELEKKVSSLFGMDRALFFPSGTMANQSAINILTNPGDQLICSKYAHVYNYEGGGVSFNSGVSCKLIDKPRGLFNDADVIDAINPPDFYHSPSTSLVCIENTTNKGGGACWDLDEIKKIKKVCSENNLKLHLDGARIWNACVEKGYEYSDFGKLFETISVCLSKGLGCPVGSILICKEKYFRKALKIRKIFGGGMRQSGYLAACGIYALDNNIKSLSHDHIRAKEISNLLKRSYFVEEVYPVETNIIIFRNKDQFSTVDFINFMDNNDVRLISMGDNKLRLVTHSDYTDNHHEKFMNLLSKINAENLLK
tara:strand:- start:1510 stop:2550 length:1041 start_codon:yes stop_codon:yes gene_type:complete